MIFKEAFEGNIYNEPKPRDLREINQIMNKSIIGWVKHPTVSSLVRFSRYGQQRAWDRIINEKALTDGFESVDDIEEQIELPFACKE